MSLTDECGRPRTAAEILDAAFEAQRDQQPALAAPAQDGSRVREDQVEDLIAAIVAGALGQPHVRPDIPFGALGGDSLAAIRVLSRVWRAFAIKLPLSMLLPQATVAELTEAVKRARALGAPTGAPLRLPSAAGAQLASPNQVAIWLAESMGPATGIYNIPYGLRLHGALGVPRLQSSLQRLLQGHEALRLRFSMRDGQLMQQVHTAPLNLELPVFDLSQKSAPERMEQALALSSELVREPFDLARPPLLRARLIRLAAAEHLLVLSIHHIVCDAWSIKLMMTELSEHYAGVRESTSPPGRGFLAFLAWQRETLDGTETQRLVAGWREALGDLLEVDTLPTDRPRSGQPCSVGATESLVLSTELVDAMRRSSGDHGVTLHMMLMAVFAVVLWARGKCDALILGTAVANREHEALSGVVGYLANMLPLRIDCGGDPTMRELLNRVRAAALGAYDRQQLSFAQLVRELAPQRRPGVNPLFQAAVILNDLSAPPMGEADTSQLWLHTGTAKLDLTLYLEERAGGLSGYIEYAHALFVPRTIRHMHMSFEALCMRTVDYADDPLSRMLVDIPAVNG